MTKNLNYKSPLAEVLDDPKASNDNFHQYRFVEFITLDGRKRAYSYSYLTSIDFENQDDMQTVTFEFTSGKVKLKGYGLEPIYQGALSYNISTVEQAYESIVEDLSNSFKPEVLKIEFS
jgi:hypothetical protein